MSLTSGMGHEPAAERGPLPVVTRLHPWRGRTWLKCEHEQVTGSFKYRGAFLAVAAQRDDHYVTASSGNHAIALGRAVRALRPAARVTCFGASIEPAKCARLDGLGVEVTLVEGDNDDRDRAAREFARGVEATFVHSSDDVHMVLGACALATEIIGQMPEVRRLVAPVGGGGLLAGLLIGVMASGRPIDVVGVEPAGAARMARSLEQGSVHTLSRVSTICDGARAVRPSRLPFDVARALSPTVVSATDEQVLSARRLLDEHGLQVEPTAALALVHPRRDELPTVIVLTGGNR